jgi:VWFA-related protein
MRSSRIAFAAMLVLPLLGLLLAVVTQTQPASAQQPAALQNSKDDSSPDAPTLHLDVRRVPVDVVVTDKDGNPVRGLWKDDFVVKEDKVPQTIIAFDYQDGSTPSYVPAKLPPLPVNTFVNVPTQPERGPLYILYYDMVNTPELDQMSAHQQLLDFVDQAQPGARFALFVNARGLHLIQGFTSDHALLRAAIVSKGPGPHLPDVFMYGRMYGYTDAGAALQCLKFIADYVNGIPGRKNLIWLSSVFPIPTGPTMTAGNANAQVGGGFSSSTPQGSDLSYLLSDNIEKTYSAMMRSQIALYPVDLAGIDPQNDAADMIVKGQQEEVIAQATGGHAYYLGNRLKPLIDKAVQNGESYYTLSYAPTNAKYDGSERSVEVTLASAKRDKYTLSYRTGYYAVSDDQVQEMDKKNVVHSRFMAAKAADTLYANIEHGAPMMHDLLFSTHLATEGKPKMATPEQMAQLQDSPAFFRTRKKNAPPPKPLPPVQLQKYRIGYGIVDAQLKTLASEKGKAAELEFAAAAYDDDGRLLNSILNQGQVPIANGKGGKAPPFFHAEQELEVPPGAASIRLAVRDTLSNRMGTIEVKLPLKPETTTAIAAKPN